MRRLQTPEHCTALYNTMEQDLELWKLITAAILLSSILKNNAVLRSCAMCSDLEKTMLYRNKIFSLHYSDGWFSLVHEISWKSVFFYIVTTDRKQTNRGRNIS